MIDKFIYSLFGWIDEHVKFLDKIVDELYTFDFPNCKPKKKRNENKRKH